MRSSVRVAVVLAAGLTACSGPAPEERAVQVTSAAPAASAAPASVSLQAPSAASTPESRPRHIVWTMGGRPITPLTFAALRSEFEEGPPAIRGPGVLCGSAPCGRDEVCCNPDWNEPSCIDAGDEASCPRTIVRCDESSDCPGDERCCGGRLDGDGFLVTCASPERCSVPWDSPGHYMIPASEVCSHGGTCKTPLTECIGDSDSTVPSGSCVSTVARVACGTGVDCPAEQPWCYWNVETKQGECIPRGPWRGRPGVLECDGEGDCPRGLCCSYGAATTVCGTTECHPDLAYAPQVCRTAKDCGDYTRPFGVGETPEVWPGTCEPDQGGPDGLGNCSFAPAHAEP
jgi:hypothetical protein